MTKKEFVEFQLEQAINHVNESDTAATSALKIAHLMRAVSSLTSAMLILVKDGE